MIEVLVNGCNGKMGQVVCDLIEQNENLVLKAGFDKNITGEFAFPVFDKIEDIKEKPDVIIDFSIPIATLNILEYASKNNVPIVIATTGFSEEQELKIKEASKFTRIFMSSNTSLGVNVLINLSKQATNILGNMTDIEIIEKHHNKKVDAPSGTAKMIANAINKELDNSMEFNYGRYGNDSKRKEKEIGIHAIRGGTIPGEHTVIFAGLDEIIEIKHTALSKKVFAQGAIKAAQYILEKDNGIYDMDMFINNN